MSDYDEAPDVPKPDAAGGDTEAAAEEAEPAGEPEAKADEYPADEPEPSAGSEPEEPEADAAEPAAQPDADDANANEPKEAEEPAAAEPATEEEPEQPTAPHKADLGSAAAAKEEPEAPVTRGSSRGDAQADDPEATEEEAAPAAAGDQQPGALAKEDQDEQQPAEDGEEEDKRGKVNKAPSAKEAEQQQEEQTGSARASRQASGAREDDKEPRPASAIADPEAHAEVDKMAQDAAREVLRSRQNSLASDARGGGKPAAAAPKEVHTAPEAAKAHKQQSKGKADGAAPGQHDGDRRLSGSASTKSVAPSQVDTKSPRPGTVESLERDKVHPPSPSKVKTGPWLTGTYKLPKSGKLITGEELCEALERMTNAYIDKYAGTEDKGGANTMPYIATGTRLFMSKKLGQDEYDAMLSRLYKPKDRTQPDSDKAELTMLKYTDEGAEQWVPVKTVSDEEKTTYMCNLYTRCIESKKKTQAELQEKYLKPLGQARRVA